MGAGEGGEEFPKAGESVFCGGVFSGADFDAEAHACVSHEVAVVGVAGASGFMRVVADLCALLVAVEGLHGTVEIEDVGDAEDGFYAVAHFFGQPVEAGSFVDAFHRAAHDLFADGAGHF